MWPATPQLNISHPAAPSSPPETPRTASPVINRQNSPKFRGLPARNQAGTKPMAQQPNARTVPGGAAFNFGRQVRGPQLSPRSTGSSAASSDSESSDSDSVVSEQPEASAPSPRPITITRISHNATFVVEEMGNFEDGDEERLCALRPDYFEYPESDRSRSRSRNPPEIDQTVMYKFRNLDCSDESDAPDLSDDDDYQKFLIRSRQERRRKRMSSGSIGKRSITESIGSDTDMEDLKVQFLDASQAGSSARRLRRKLGNRQSLQFQDPPLPRIDQADEPETSDDEFLDDDALKELPYYTLDYITMEIDSP
ncbi:hypothetical protein CONLIGDRAFT_683501 [Coniochaeta ligniaria NRRL 30616]|uniref:Uncharacterized protein n=1 Tax=Coniochaeta ligniaria NRRL 30616 TaxID=1408157 RepID=A0A1J7IFQ5_9PEZI|nr:hypothetical protein CONLIGDRAFT_683501 [Coniochaeta ligniaria NRRL 30616]